MGMGDAWQRGMNISKLGLSDEAHQIAFGLKGGNVNVYSSLGDVQFGNNGYVALFATENTPATVPWPNFVAGSRNLALIHIVQNFEQLQHEGRSFDPDKYDVRIVDTHLHNTAAENFEVIVEPYGPYTAYNKGVVWLTDYDDINDAHANRPKMVKINDDRFMVLWEKWTQTEYIETFAMIVDEYGHILSPATSLGNSARLHRGDDAFALGDKAAWVVGEADVPRLVLYTVDENLSLEVFEIL
jgi:hypothetical protein